MSAKTLGFLDSVIKTTSIGLKRGSAGIRRSMLKSNAPINPIISNTVGVAAGIAGDIKSGKMSGQTFKNAFLNNPKEELSFANLDKSSIAGSYVGLSAAGRIASGGGVYKDADGNTDIIGMPII